MGVIRLTLQRGGGPVIGPRGIGRPLLRLPPRRRRPGCAPSDSRHTVRNPIQPRDPKLLGAARTWPERHEEQQQGEKHAAQGAHALSVSAA
jgi:hypothetical protein